MSDTIFLCLRNSKIANFLGSVSFFEPTPKENNSAGKPKDTLSLGKPENNKENDWNKNSNWISAGEKKMP